MPVIKPTSLVWTCRACGYKITNQPDSESYKTQAFEHSKTNHSLITENKEFFWNKFRSFYDIA